MLESLTNSDALFVDGRVKCSADLGSPKHDCPRIMSELLSCRQVAFHVIDIHLTEATGTSPSLFMASARVASAGVRRNAPASDVLRRVSD